MLGDVPPPSYTDVQASPPRYSFPETFTIGHRSVDLLVQPQQLRGHLSLLHAFHNLRATVESNDHPRIPVDVRAMEPEQRWGWFVSIAVERFDRWCRTLGDWCSANLELALPPLDVLMVLHAYLLNPIWYAEDTGHISKLSHLPALTEYIAASIASPGLLTSNPAHPNRVHVWERFTHTPYDPFNAAAVLSHKEIQCPCCGQQTGAPFLGPNGSGYAQSNFAVNCTSCGKTIKKDLLGLYKFANDIVKTAGFLSGTLHTPFHQRDVDRAALIKQRIMAAARLPSNMTTAQQVMQKLNSDPASLSRILSGQIQRRIGRRISSAYVDDRPFSVDLVGAVLRQGTFVRKMVDLGWTDPAFFAEEEEMVVLQHCVARYHAFLGLMADAPGSFFVPTLDIDLAWHTHQLMGTHYHADCKRVVGRYIDHDDKVDEDHLATAFDVTCRAWTDRYGLPYTYCGCPLPGTTLGQRLRHALSLHRQRTRESKSKELDMLRPVADAAGGTHPSDHNAVYPMHDRNAEHARERRRRKAERRRRRQALDANATAKKNGPGLLCKRNQPQMRAQTQTQTRTETHALAFFYPVPMWFGAASCVGVPFVIGNGTCATGVGGSCMAACAGPGCVSVGQCNGGSSCGGGGGCGGGGCGGGGCGGGG